MLPSLRALFSGRDPQIPQELWAEQVRRMPWLQGWDAAELESLRANSARFLAQKSMTGAAGLVLDAPMQLHIAAQACVPISRLGLHWYRGWSGVIVYPASFLVHRSRHHPDGVVQEFDAELTGEAWAGGPVVLSWEDAASVAVRGEGRPAPGGPAWAYNVVIHEFAHKIDLLDGEADGIPPFDARLHAGLGRKAWQSALEDAYERFCAELDLVESGIPGDVDPESADADGYYAHLPLDPYAASEPGEFFAVSSEAFFLDPGPMERAFPRWHDCLRRFYRPEAH